jgi:hypothetical protein
MTRFVTEFLRTITLLLIRFERIKNGAGPHRGTPVTGRSEMNKGLFDAQERTDFFLNIGDLRVCPRFHFSAADRRIHAKGQQLADFAQRKPERLGTPDKAETRHGVLGVAPIARCPPVAVA